MTARSDGGPGRLVFGLGHPDRGDDAVGPRVVRLLARRVTTGDGVRTGTGVEPLTLLDLLEPGDGLVLVDAVRTGAPAGTVLVRDLTADPLPATGSPASGHLLGLDQVLALAGAVDRLTGPVHLVGVEAERFDHGAGLSAPVRAAVPEAVDAVLELLAPRGPRAGRIGGCRPTTASSPAPSPPAG